MRGGRSSPAPWLLASLLWAAAAPALSLHLIGCLYEDLCEDSERCFNDGAFGRCVSKFSNPEQLSRVKLSHDDLAELATLLEMLVAQGHRWSHIYTQCILQTKLLVLQTGEPHDTSACELVNGRPGEWLPQPLPGLPALEIDPPRYPSLQDSKEASNKQISPLDEEQMKPYLPDAYRQYGELLVREDDDRPPDELGWTSGDQQQAGEYGRALDSALMGDPGLMKRSPNRNIMEEQQEDTERPTEKAQLRRLLKLIDDVQKLAELQVAAGEAEQKSERQHWQPQESPLAELERAEAAGRRRQEALAEALLLPDDGDAELIIDYEAEPLADFADFYDAAPIPLSVRSDPEFQRAERLDIKKPGPWFGVNNYAFDYDYDGKSPTLEEFQELERLPIEPMEPAPSSSETRSGEGNRADLAWAVDNESRRMDEVATDVTKNDVTTTEQATPTPIVTRQEPKAIDQHRKKSLDKFTRYPDPKDAIDASYVFVRVKEPFQRWKNGKQLVEQVEQRLGLPHNTFDNIRVAGDLVNFRVNQNPLGYNSTSVTSKIRDLRTPLESQLGIVMVETGQGNGTGATSSVLLETGRSTLLVQTLSIVLGVLVACVLLVVVVVYVLRRASANSKDKLKSLSNPDAEASKDYQELCRSRMAARVSEKEQPEKAQRVHSLSKESDGTASPTSRSSTSSWSEEPVVSNMDISTGHMVLSYMEDHLKRKDKLEEEWRALCAYEAEPSARTIATQPENTGKNRRPSVLPYDHSRVTLNAVTNATGGNYINASSITDHDPRNPAYIATQGPLPHTANDFWQMVWEQGSVVIVMLTRLTENGASMCHRYWPEEGSELYHIYEVHLVSEHIWCDEYLVRSFYLKNLKTSETRTVTQFHFLAWPENAVPSSTKALLEFRRKVNKSYRGRSCPVIVHCSDGAGRTGTYCLIDMVLNRMSKGAKEIDIAASLEHIRDQRVTMVRTRGQFEFVLMAVAEEVHAILKALPQ